MEQIIEELEKIRKEMQSIIVLADSRGEDTKLAYQCQIVINERISELKGKNKLTCDRNICLQNEYNNIGCEDCVVANGTHNNP